ncbi:hypothetical protein CS063_02105 [Sporanaerobium hydrogeniformans]|uniref:Uncharacterized protein n=1 Tax=Sporanaerobium hydrogeniformans TaxID=3072179 RepID=A0AC61DI80_9FIRM|nr:hypothetical protein [Sporanaerobium hydrogeniformans]PHV72291.1 hypothetical protein CS063_02105 [Sporanaerobium hydrogeniformans]
MKKRQAFIALLLGLSLVGCEPKNQPTINNPVDIQTPSPSLVEEIRLPDNEAFRRIDTQSLELGVIVNNPDTETLKNVSQLEYYKDEINDETLLLVPKYKDSKVEILGLEYENESLVMKEPVYVVKATPEGYGLLIETNRPEGIPRLLIRVSYNEKTSDYIISSHLKEGEPSLEYLKAVDSKEKEGELIEATKDSGLFKGLNLINEAMYDMDKDGKVEEKLLLYSEAQQDQQGNYMLDDGQNWLLVAQIGEEFYPLFGPGYIQLGTLKYTAYEDYTKETFGVLINRTEGAGIKLYECVYDKTAKAFKRSLVYQTTGNIGIVEEWNQ